MPIYQDYAHVYDRSGQLAFSLKMIPYLGRVLDRHPVVGRTMVDLACGTGTVAVALAQAGWRVDAVDGSAEMLAQARAKAAADEVTLRASQQDMRSFALPEPVHWATCLYDSMNYMLTSADLLAVFRSVFAALLPGGLFCFDMNTAWALSTFWDDATYFTDTDDLTVIMQSNYSSREQRTTVTVTCFRREGEKYVKFSEQHTEQAYPTEHIALLLTDVGFTVEAQYECFSFHAPTPTSSRILYVARKDARYGLLAH
jgi:SAM-dependent methyltransferase